MESLILTVLSNITFNITIYRNSHINNTLKYAYKTFSGTIPPPFQSTNPVLTHDCPLTVIPSMFFALWTKLLKETFDAFSIIFTGWIRLSSFSCFVLGVSFDNISAVKSNSVRRWWFRIQSNCTNLTLVSQEFGSIWLWQYLGFISIWLYVLWIKLLINKASNFHQFHSCLRHRNFPVRIKQSHQFELSPV